MNTIPVFIHQESEQEGNVYFSSFKPFAAYQPFVQNVFRVSDPTGNELYKKMGLGKTTLKKALHVFNQQMKLVKKGFTMALKPKSTRADGSQMPGIYLIEDGLIRNVHRYETVSDNVDLLDMVIDTKRSGTCSEAVCNISGGIEKTLFSAGTILSTDTEDTNVLSIKKLLVDPYNESRKKQSKKVTHSYELDDVLENENAIRYLKLFCAKGIEHIISLYLY
jgi:hypothetical protein